MNRGTIREQVIQATGRSDKVDFINSSINIALEEVSSRHLWSELLEEGSVPLVASQDGVDLGVASTRILDVRIDDGVRERPLSVRTLEWVHRRFPNRRYHSIGKPAWGYFRGKTLITTPIPDDAYTVRFSYFSVHPSLEDDSDEVLITYASPAVIAYTTFWVFQAIEKNTEATQWFNVFQTRLQSAKKLDMSNHAIQYVADQRGDYLTPAAEYWLDPFVRAVPV